MPASPRNIVKLLNQKLLANGKPEDGLLPKDRELLEHYVFAIFMENAPLRAAREAFEALEDYFIDWNEIRVSTTLDLVDVLPMLPFPQRAAERVRRSLQWIFETTYKFDLEEWRKKDASEFATFLSSIPFSTRFINDYLLHFLFGQTNIPFDEAAMRVMRLLDLVDISSENKEVVKGIERTFTHGDADQFFFLLHQFSAEMMADPEMEQGKKLLKTVDPESENRTYLALVETDDDKDPSIIARTVAMKQVKRPKPSMMMEMDESDILDDSLEIDFLTDPDAEETETLPFEETIVASEEEEEFSSKPRERAKEKKPAESESKSAEAAKKPEKKSAKSESKSNEAVKKPEKKPAESESKSAEAAKKPEKKSAKSEGKSTEAAKKPEKKTAKSESKSAEAVKKPDKKTTESESKPAEAAKKPERKTTESEGKSAEAVKKPEKKTAESESKSAEAVKKPEKKTAESESKSAEAAKKPEKKTAESESKSAGAAKKPHVAKTVSEKEPEPKKKADNTVSTDKLKHVTAKEKEPPPAPEPKMGVVVSTGNERAKPSPKSAEKSTSDKILAKEAEKKTPDKGKKSVKASGTPPDEITTPGEEKPQTASKPNDKQDKPSAKTTKPAPISAEETVSGPSNVKPKSSVKKGDEKIKKKEEDK